MDERWRLTEGLWDRIIWSRMQAGFERKIDAAESLGIKQSTYRSYERPVEKDGRIPPLSEIQRLARKFKVSWAWLASGTGTPHDEPGPQIEAIDRLTGPLGAVPEDKREDALAAAVAVLESFARRA